MHRHIVALGTMLFLAFGEADAQNPTITLLKGLSFGMTITGVTNTIAPTDPRAAEVEIDFHGYGGWFDILSVLPGLLPKLSPAVNSPRFSSTLYGTNVYGDQAGATSVSSGDVVSLSGNRRTTGYYYFRLGGSIDPVPAGQPPGDYTGSLVLNVAY